MLGKEIGQRLSFHSFLRHVLQTKLGQRHRPFPNSALHNWPGKHVPDNVGLGNDLGDRREHVMPELGCGEKYGETQFLDGGIIDLWLIEIPA